MTNQKKRQTGQKFTKTIWNDFTQTDFVGTVRREWKDIYDFYLDDETRTKIEKMGKVKRWFYFTVYLLKSLFFKLTSFRRIMLVVGFFFTFYESDTGRSFPFLGFYLVLLILILELKDKLLAQDELAVGRAVQFALMPEHNPSFPGWDIWLFTRSANEVSGDLVDYMLIDKDRLGAALGDVAGKGLGAALFMAKLQATLRALAPNYSSFAHLGAEINKIFCRDGLPSRFASLLYLEIKPDSGKVRVLNAGHLPPIGLIDESFKEMPKGTPALGLTMKSKYEEQNIQLQPGDLLIVYSDGLTEARNEKGEFYGDKRLEDLIPKLKNLTAQTAGNRILSEIERFVGEAHQSDDLSMIILKRTG